MNERESVVELTNDKKSFTYGLFMAHKNQEFLFMANQHIIIFQKL